MNINIHDVESITISRKEVRDRTTCTDHNVSTLIITHHDGQRLVIDMYGEVDQGFEVKEVADNGC